MTIYQGDVLDVLEGLPDDAYTAVFCDPPYGLNFMGRRWDHGVPSRAVWEEALRVCKPGAVLMAFGGTRTFHRLAVNIEDAGWELFDTIMWVYGSGFPKSTSISKNIDREAGAEREVVGSKVGLPGYSLNPNPGNGVAMSGNVDGSLRNPEKECAITAPATDVAQTWDGYGTALKPAWEPIILARKPRTKTYAQHAVEDGTGALNIDGCRVPTEESLNGGSRLLGDGIKYGKINSANNGDDGYTQNSQGRFPANLIHDGSPEVLDVFARAGERTSGNLKPGHKQGKGMFGHIGGDEILRDYGGDSGSAARFFYCAKSSRRERNAGLEGMPEQHAPKGNYAGRDMSNQKNHLGGLQGSKMKNHHPCVKPLSLTEYIARLLVPPEPYRDDARILIPFAGSMSEAIGAMLAGWRNIDAIELEEEYIEIGRRRFEWWEMMKRQTRLSDPGEILARVYPEDAPEEPDESDFDDLPLFQ